MLSILSSWDGGKIWLNKNYQWNLIYYVISQDSKYNPLFFKKQLSQGGNIFMWPQYF